MYDTAKLAALRDNTERLEETTLPKTLARRPERREQFIITSSEPIECL